MDIDFDKIGDRAVALRQWGIRPIADEERLGPSHYPEEFVEF